MQEMAEVLPCLTLNLLRIGVRGMPRSHIQRTSRRRQVMGTGSDESDSCIARAKASFS